MPSVQEIREIIIRGKSDGLDKVKSDLNAVAAAQERVADTGQAVAVVTDSTTKKQLSAAAAVDRLRKAVDDEYRSQQAFLAGQRNLDRALAQGAITTEDHGRILGQLSAKYLAAKTSNDNFAASAAGGAKLAAHEVQNLGFQLNDAVTMLASGSSPFQVIATQGGQVYQALAGSRGGVVGSIKELGSGLLGLITPARLVTAGIVGIGIAAALSYSSYADGQRQLANSLQGLGRSTNATVAQLESVAEAAASASHIGVGAARDLTAGFASTGKIGADLYESLIEATKRYAALTSTDLADAGKDLAAAFAAPGKGAKDLDSKLNFLNLETLQYIRNLDNTNQRGRAQKVMLDELIRNLPDAAQNVTLLGKAWQGVAGFADAAYAAMGRAVHEALHGPGLEEELAQLQKQLALVQSKPAATVPKGFYGSTQDASEELKLRERIAEVETKIADQRERAKKAQSDLDAKAAQAIVQERDPRIDQLTEAIAKESALNEAIKKGAGNTELFKETLSGVKNEIDGLTDGDRKLVTVAEQLRRERELILAVDKAATSTQKAEAQAALTAFREKKNGASDAVAAARAEDEKLQALSQTYAGLTQAARDRRFAVDQAAAQQQLEIDLIGKSAEQQALLRANFQSYWELRKEELQNGTGFDQEQYAWLQ